MVSVKIVMGLLIVNFMAIFVKYGICKDCYGFATIAYYCSKGNKKWSKKSFVSSMTNGRE